MKECVLLLIILSQFASVLGQYTNGDVRLVNGNATTGVLEVLINDKWGTVCIHQFNIGSAAAACRQLGFLQSTSYGLPSDYNLNPSSLNSVLINVTCPDDGDTNFATSGLLHILRCLYSVAINSCDVNHVVALNCDTTLITANPYNGQVRLISGNNVKSSGFLEIFLHNRWGAVCSENFNDAAADSVCRQLGYTSSDNFSTVLGPSSKPVWIDSITCDSSHSCFSTSCIPHNPTAIISESCETNRNDVIVNCTFTSTDGGKLLSGNEYICRIHSRNILIIVLPTVFGSLICVLLCFLLFVCICCFSVSTCPLYAHKTKRKYEGLI